MTRRTLIFTGLLMEAGYVALWFSGPPPGDMLAFIVVQAVVYLLLCVLLWRLRRTPGGKPAPGLLPLILGFALLFRLTLVAHAPVGSDDLYRYLWDGRVAASGINPYAHAPDDPQLAHLATSDLPSKVNSPWMRTPYPPVAQYFFLASHLLFGGSTTGLKLLLVLADCGTVLLLLLLARALRCDERYVLLYGWSPLPVLYFALDGHIDALGICLLVLFLFLYATRRETLSSLALGMAALAKLYPLFIVPLLIRSGSGLRRFFVPGIALAVVAAGYLLWYEPTGGLVDGLMTFTRHWFFNSSIFMLLLGVFQGNNAPAHLASGLLFVCWMVWLFVARRPLIEKSFLAFLGFIILGPVVHPWYLTWLGAFLVVRWSPSVFLLLGLSNLSNIVVWRYHATGVWRDDPFLLLLEYLPFFLFLAWEAGLFRHGPFRRVLPSSGEDQNEERKPTRASRSALRIAALYALFAGLWILFSDMVVEWFLSDPHLITRVAIIKGWFFVLFTATLLYWVLRLELQNRTSAEAARWESELRFLRMAETTSAAIFIYEGERLRYANAGAERLTGYSAAELLAVPAWSFVHPDQRALVAERSIARQAGLTVPARYEFMIVTRQGETRWVDFTSGLVLFEGRAAALGTAFDITDRKLAEEQIKASLREKELLLKEIHHRVKNNMQVISSLLRLQADYVHDKQDLALFEESQLRVHSMALIHEKLYGSRDLARVDFAEYIRDLTSGLLRSYSPAGVTLNVDVAPVAFAIDTAIPCGLLVHELVSNALKYAFPDGMQGTVTVFLRETGEGRYRLRVSDNGVGLPPGLDFRQTRSLGLQLAVTLVAQIDGTIMLEPGPGTTFCIDFGQRS